MSKVTRKWLAPGDPGSSAWVGYDETDIEIADCLHRVTLHFGGNKGKAKFFRLLNTIVAFGVQMDWLEEDDG